MTAKGAYMNLHDRLARHIEPCPMTGCWLFSGKHDKDGYGVLSNPQCKDFKAHRLAWELHHSAVAPSSMDVAHHCDVRACVNPSHLYLATRKQNLLDRTARMREARGERVGGAKLTESAVRDMRSSTEHWTVLAERHGVSRSRVYAIRSRISWKHVKC